VSTSEHLNPGVTAKDDPGGRATRHRSESACRAWRMTSWVAAVFSVLLSLSMLAGQLTTRTLDPLKSPQLKALKEKLRLTPGDEVLKENIRQLDLRLRQSYFRQVSRMHSGVYLLLGGVGVFILAVSQAGGARPAAPMPQPKTAAEQVVRPAAQARWSVAGVGAGVGGLLFALSLGLSTPLPRQPAELEKLLGATETPEPVSDAVSAAELKQNWPRFRGYEGGGVALSTNVPATWDVATGAGIAWKVPVPASGFNSPITWGDRVFFSGGDASKREVFCLALKSGQLLWRQAVSDVPGSPAQPQEIPESTGYAAPTMATDGHRVYVIFGNGELAAFTLEGALVWSKSFGVLKNAYGHATSLATWHERLLVQLDQGEAEEGKSKLYALDGRTGQVVWQKPRKAGGAWASPIVIEAAGQAQILALAVPHVAAYAAADGADLWRVECLNGEVTPSPVFADGLVIVASPSEKLVAIRPDGHGDVTKTHIVWSAEENVPDVTSPVSNGELVFAVTTSGLLTCYDGKDGKKQWEHDFEMETHASPAIAGRRLYLFSQKGTAVVVEAGRQFKALFRADMGDAFHASPAFTGNGMVLRGTKYVWCLRDGAAADKEAKR
jgi:outer membrane protein assembly factor BamB